jgi:hypothetical protein
MPETRWNDREGRFEVDRDRDFGEGRDHDDEAARRERQARAAAPPRRRGGEFLRAQAQGGDIGYGRVVSGAGYGPGSGSFHAPGDYGMVGGVHFGGGANRYVDYGRPHERPDDAARDFGAGSHDLHGGHHHHGEGHGWLERARDEVASWVEEHDPRHPHPRHAGAHEGEHRGHGPKNYRRSDARVLEDVSDRLSDDSWLDARAIEVAVENGEVTLNGLVASRDDKRQAEMLIESVSGVGHVQNNLRVAQPEADPGTGAGRPGGTSMGGMA